MISNALIWFAVNGRVLLVVGLIAGISLPDIALFLKEYLGLMVAALLFLNAFRIGSSATLGSRAQLKASLVLIVVLQLVLPCGLVLALGLFSIDPVSKTALIIMASAASISGAPNITRLLGHDPAVSQRLLILGTALLLLTILPVFSLSPNLGSADLVIPTALRLLLVIVASAGLAYFIREKWFSKLEERQLQAVDGLSVLVMAVVVIGLMSALGPALINNPEKVLWTLVLVFAVNYGLQIFCFFSLKVIGPGPDQVGISVVSGNRNMALFLAALPVATTEPLLLFIACYQLPMYLTPVLLGPIYGNRHI